MGLAARLAGTTLAAYLVWIALRQAPRALPPATAGWLGSGTIAAAAFVAGWLAAVGLGEALAGGAGEGPGIGAVGASLAAGSPVARAALAASLALAAVALPQVVIPRDTLRLGTGCLLLLASATLPRRTRWAGARTPSWSSRWRSSRRWRGRVSGRSSPRPSASAATS